MKGGVLIIGSLLWQDDLNIEKQDGLRIKWRKDHLILKEKVAVKTSICYGRFSEKDDIFTMVFSTGCINRKCGTAFIVPFTGKCEAYKEIEKEALSYAEGMKGKFISKKSNGEIWSVVSYLTNPILSRNSKIYLLMDGKPG